MAEQPKRTTRGFAAIAATSGTMIDTLADTQAGQLKDMLRPDLFKQFSARCKQENRTLVDVLRDAVRAYLANNRTVEVQVTQPDGTPRTGSIEVTDAPPRRQPRKGK